MKEKKRAQVNKRKEKRVMQRGIKMFKETIINILGEKREDIVSIKQDQDKRDQKQQK